jgi:hypothetical protein
MIARALTTLVLCALAGCSCGDGSLLERSCDGEAVALCEPYEYAVVTEGSITPMEITLGDPRQRAMVHVRYDKCERAPGNHQVRISALTGGVMRPDGGGGAALVSLVTVRDDGAGGDTVAGDGEIDVMVDNPFSTTLPEESDLELRFEPFLPPGCSGETLGGVPYRTGVRFAPDAGP